MARFRATSMELSGGDCRVMEFWNASLVPPLSFKRRETRIGVKQAANRSMTFRRSALMFSLSIEGKKTAQISSIFTSICNAIRDTSITVAILFRMGESV